MPGQPNHPGVILEGLFFNMQWRNGYSGPYSPQEAQRRSSTLSRAGLVYENPWGEDDAGDSELLSKFRNSEVQVKTLEGMVNTLKASLEQQGINPDEEARVVIKNKKLSNIIKVRHKKTLMKKTGFKWDRFSSFKEAWTHYSTHVLPYVVN